MTAQKSISSFFTKKADSNNAAKRKSISDENNGAPSRKKTDTKPEPSESNVSKFSSENSTVQKKTQIRAKDKETPVAKPTVVATQLTPYQQQLKELMLKHNDTVLFIEEGYRYRVLGKDAEIVSKLGGLMFKPGRLYAEDGHEGDEQHSQFAHCVFLNNNLKTYIEKMIRLGYKVGVVSQMETAALKAAGDNKSQPMERKLTQLYTSGTFVNVESGGHNSTSNNNDGDMSGYFLAIREKKHDGSNAQRFAIIAVQASTGRIMYDEFVDNPILNELKTRLLHILPSEVLYIGEVGQNVTQLVNNALNSGAYTVRVNKSKPHSITDTATFLNEFFTDIIAKATSDIQVKSEFLQKVTTEFPEPLKTCLHSLIEHFTEFGMESLFQSPRNYSPFNTNLSMLLNANALSSLEIFRNQTDNTLKGSLFEVLDHTNTPYGNRLLKNWIGRPLVKKADIESRLDAVTELKAHYSSALDKILQVMKKSTIDIEKGITNIYYQRSSRKQVFFVLQEFKKFSEITVPKGEYKSSILHDIFKSLPKLKPIITELMDKINIEEMDFANYSDRDLKFNFFKDDEFDGIFLKSTEVSQIKKELEKYLENAKTETGIDDLQYITDKETEYLLRVKKKDVNKVPDSWMKWSQTKELARYSTQETKDLMGQLELKRDQLGVECDKAFKEFLVEIKAYYEELRSSVNSVATLDCLVSLTATAYQPHFVRATYVEDTQSLKITEGLHPITQYKLKSSYIPNDITISESHDRTMVITGPNMGGKSSYVRQVALITIMAQIGSFIPAASAEIGIVDAIYTRMGAYDNILSGESTFLVELQECSSIMQAATDKSLVILDEVGRGTSTIDGSAIARAVLSYFITEKKSRTLFITHYPMLTSLASVFPETVCNYHMGYQEYFNGEYTEVVFLYKLVKGISKGSYG